MAQSSAKVQDAAYTKVLICFEHGAIMHKGSIIASVTRPRVHKGPKRFFFKKCVYF